VAFRLISICAHRAPRAMNLRSVRYLFALRERVQLRAPSALGALGFCLRALAHTARNRRCVLCDLDMPLILLFLWTCPKREAGKAEMRKPWCALLSVMCCSRAFDVGFSVLLSSVVALCSLLSLVMR
jgi:hypothetical protein